MELRLQAALQGSLPWWPSVSLPYDYNLQQPLPESVPGQKDPQCLIEQIHLSGKCILFCFFTGRCEQLFLQIFDCFIEICDRLVQLCGLFLMAFGHLLDRKALAVYQLTQGFNCLFLKLYERFHF